ncbi:MAG: hypothetical protein ACYTHJ_19350 [Planctomycetota bacterium]
MNDDSTQDFHPGTSRTASIVALILGLLVFIPVAPQVVAIAIGLFAVVRRRLPGERVSLAWIGLLIASLALAGWLYLFFVVRAARVTTAVTATPTWAPVATTPTEYEAMERVGVWVDAMHRVQVAAGRYHRDYKRWPQSLDDLRGKSLPPKFELPEGLTFLRVAADETDLSCPLVESDPSNWNEDGEQVSPPVRLIIPLQGDISEVVVAPE